MLSAGGVDMPKELFSEAAPWDILLDDGTVCARPPPSFL